MAKKLHYFDFKGIGESIRFMLHYADQKFEDIRYDYKTFSEADVKKTFPFGQLPVYEEGNRTLNQSLAIARYVGAAHNLMPTDPWDQAHLDAVVFSVYDFWAKIVTYLMEQEPVKREKLRREVFEEVIDFYLSRFEDQLKNNRGYFGGTISWADFVFIGILESVKLHLGDQIYRKYPHIVALQEIVTTLPRVKEYISTRKHDVIALIRCVAIDGLLKNRVSLREITETRPRQLIKNYQVIEDKSVNQHSLANLMLMTVFL